MPTLLEVSVEGGNLDAMNVRNQNTNREGSAANDEASLGDIGELEGCILPASEVDDAPLLDDTTLMDVSIREDGELAIAGDSDENLPPANNSTLSSVEAMCDGLKGAFNDDETGLVHLSETHLESSRRPDGGDHHGDFGSPSLGARKAGPNERQYRRQFETYVLHVVSDFQRRHPGQLRDFCTMSDVDKKRDQRRVSGLLSRLGISGNSPTLLPCRAHHVEPTSTGRLINSSSDSSKTRLESDLSNGSIATAAGMKKMSRLPLQDESVHADKSSEVLLSPETEVDRLASRVSRSMALLSQQDDSSDASSVELVRRDQRLSSPPMEYKSPPRVSARSKRLATTSGKKGADVSRLRVDDDSFVSFDAAEARESQTIHSPSQLLTKPACSPDSMLFPASQSPIRERTTSWENSSPESVSAGGGARRVAMEDRSMMTDTIQTIDCTVNYRNRVRGQDQSYLRELPVNVQLKDGAAFCMKPLSIQRPAPRDRRGGRPRDLRGGTSSPSSLPDPLDGYAGRLGQQMYAVYDWIEERDEMSTEGNTMGGIVFSMHARQIVDMVIRLLVHVPSNHSNLNLSQEDALAGGTLLVVRSKEDLDGWQSALREGTSYSVLNHAAMTLSERKRVSTASMCCGYDVVVTTFDSLKSKDVALPLDEEGHVVHEKVGCHDGWYASRTSGNDGPQRCEELSVLHQVVWRRVVFVDVLGRKCFLAKLGTARATAAAALNSNSRFVFFCDVEGTGNDKKMNPVKALKLSDRTAFPSVGAVLHVPQAQAEERLSGDAKVDLLRSVRGCKRYA